jgi:trans-feruloyl-CoA hydratase/vanillin synthase
VGQCGRQPATPGPCAELVAEEAFAVNELANELKSKNPHVLRAAKEAFKYSADMNWEECGNYFNAKSKELDLLTGTAWKKGVDQFKKKEYRPGLGGYDWKKEDNK